MRCEEINIRDPFVMVHDGTYYMYGTRGKNAFYGEQFGFDVYTSKDLEQWEGPFEVFHRPENFFSKKNYWAPEVYHVNGRFYMFATFASQKKGLGTVILAAGSPKGQYTMWSDGYVTPHDWRALDGTLYYSQDNKPYMVFCHEWKQVHDGTICAMPLSYDLREPIGEPVVLFSASEAKPFVRKQFFFNFVTDGPFLIRTDDGKLHMLWSTMGEKGYAEAMSHSDNDEIDGHWAVDENLLYDHDGGHGMIFKDLEGNYQLVLHYPNTFEKEHPVFMPLSYDNGTWKLVK